MSTKKRAALILAYKRVFSSKDGEVVLHDMMRAGHIFQPVSRKPNIDSMTDPLDTAFRDGERSMVLRLITYMKQDYNAFLQHAKLEEQNEKESEYEW